MALLAARFKGIVVAAVAALLGACASETWDNRFDPESKGYRKPCADAPADRAADCVLWEEFDHGLDRWQVDAVPAGQDAVKIVAAHPDGKVATVLALPKCSAGASIEIEVPAPQLVLEVIWRPVTSATLAITLGGKALGTIDGPIPDDADAAKYAGWTESFADISGKAGSTTGILKLAYTEKAGACDGYGAYIARVSLRERSE